MSSTYIENEHYHGADFRQNKLSKGEYENCTFHNCQFAECDLNEILFVECEFQDCDFSMARSKGSSFRDVRFIRSKLLGLRFDECNPLLLSFSFQGCVMNFSSFYKLKIKGTVFKDCKLEEADFAEADLSGVSFDHCDLVRATFDNSILTGADFRTASNYSFDPEKNKIRKAKFSLTGLPGLMDKYDIVIE